MKEYSNSVFCPYRVCPIGAHVDHQFGCVTGFAIDKGITIKYNVTDNGEVVANSKNMPEEKTFNVLRIKEKTGDWADHLRGTVKILKDEGFEIVKGIDCHIEGALPIGGLSSSAAVIIAFMSAICEANDICLSKEQIIMLAQRVENVFVGVACGTLDQSCEVYSKKEHLLYLDTLDGKYDLIPQSKKMQEYEIGIFFSGVPRSLAGTAYNMRVDECKSSAYFLKAISDMSYGKYKETHLRDVPVEVFERYKSKLPLKWRRRAEHYYSEEKRVMQAAKYWKKGDLQGFGKLMFESGKSSIEKYETGSPELKALYESMLTTEGIYGGRFSGAGFKGCCVALVDPAFKESISKKITEEYIKKFPELKNAFEIHYCKTADGVRM